MAERPIVLFDVMDTLVVDPFRVHIPAFFGLELSELLAQKHPTAWVDFEKGLIGEAEYAGRMFADGRTVDPSALAAHVRDAYRWVEGIEPLLAELSRAGVEMHALSNYPVWYRMIEERLGLSRFVSWRFVSCETGHRKPDAEAYLNAAKRLERDPEGLLFVDDRKVNCDAARAVGMRAHRFTKAAALRAELVELGFL
jgi:FMN phosphatase YigB (HAD superfamily)